jgi:hypothetical protein
MIKFEVSAETPEAFASAAMSAFGLLTIGLQQVIPALQAQMTLASKQSTPTSASSVEAQPDAELTSSEIFDKLDTPVMEPLENPKVGDISGSKPPKLEDLQAALAKVITTSAAWPWWNVARARAYAQQLLDRFGAKKISDVPEKDRAFFLELAAKAADPDGLLF